MHGRTKEIKIFYFKDHQVSLITAKFQQLVSLLKSNILIGDFICFYSFNFILLRYSYNGNTSVFQTEARGSIPLYRCIFFIYEMSNVFQRPAVHAFFDYKRIIRH